jgi:DNA-binding NarL/FixJ family response regulator
MRGSKKGQTGDLMGNYAARSELATLATAAPQTDETTLDAGSDENNGLRAGRVEPAPENRTAVILVELPLWVRALSELAESSDIRVVGSARDTVGALDLISRLRPGVFIAEIDEDAGIAGLEVVRAARRIDPELRVIVLSKERDRASIIGAFGAGADLYVLNDADPEDLSAAMRQLFNQSLFIAADWALPSPVQNSIMNSNFPSLTRREFEILQLVAEGHTNGSIASMLWVTEQTIKFHLTNIYRKLDVRNRTEASRWAQLHGLLSLTHAKQAIADVAV